MTIISNQHYEKNKHERKKRGTDEKRERERGGKREI
jgi:hypothetical protein